MIYLHARGESEWLTAYFSGNHVVYNSLGDGVRLNRLPPWQADDSYQPSSKDSIVQAYLWISLGAVLGASLRYAVSRWTARLLSPALPFGTFFINVSGSLLLGFFLVWTTERVLADPRWRLLVAIGFCGSYTTFSSYAFETFAYFEQGHWWLFATNLLANNLFSLAAVLVGAAVARWL